MKIDNEHMLLNANRYKEELMERAKRANKKAAYKCFNTISIWARRLKESQWNTQQELETIQTALFTAMKEARKILYKKRFPR